MNRRRPHANGLELRRHMHDVLLLIDHEFRLIAIQSMDASLPVVAGLAHVRAVHLARRALPASAPDSEYGEVSRFHACD